MRHCGRGRSELTPNEMLEHMPGHPATLLPPRQFEVVGRGVSNSCHPSYGVGRYNVFVGFDLPVGFFPDGRGVILGAPYDSLTVEGDIDAIAKLIWRDVVTRGAHYDVRGVWQATHRLAGRWLVILPDHDGEISIFGDAAMLMPVFHCRRDGFFASSSLSYLTGVVEPEIEPWAARDFAGPRYLRPDMVEQTKGRTDSTWWRLDVTPYSGVRSLIPNHVVHSSGRIERLWPAGEHDYPNRLSVENASEAVLERLINVLKAVPRSGTVKMPLTAGLDSRTLVAAALAADIPFDCYTYAPSDTASTGQDFHADMAIAKRICEDFNIKHDELLMPVTVNKNDVGDIFRNVREQITSPTLPREIVVLKNLIADQAGIFLNGNMAEIGRVFYGPFSWKNADERLLASITRATNETPILTAYGRWLSDLKPYAKKFSMTDLLYWEDRMGNWQSSFQQQVNPIAPIVSPFNCHAILTTMLALPIGDRIGGSLQKTLIKKAKPRLMKYPFNPEGGSFSFRIKHGLKTRLRSAARRNAFLNALWFRLRPI